MPLNDEAIRKLLDEATPGPWWICDYDAGDYTWYDHNGPCPSIQAPDEYDCAIVHWDGFKQEFWSACNGDQKQIEANARLIAAAPDLAQIALDRGDEIARLRNSHDVLSAHLLQAEARERKLREQLRIAEISVEAMAEVKATSDGLSDQPIAAIVAGAIAQIAALGEADA